MSTIWVTGASGYIGSALVPALMAARHKANTERVEVCNWYPVQQHVRAVRPDTVIHLACNTLGGFTTNVIGTVMVADSLEPGQRLVFASSLTAANPRHAESTTYDQEKWDGENMLRCRPHLQTIILRLGTVYGEPIRSTKRSVLNRLIAQAARGDGLALYGNAYALRDYVHLDDVVAAFVKALDAPPGTYDVGTGTGTSLLAAGQEVARQAGVDWYIDDSATDGPAFVANRTKWVPGWRPEISLAQGIERTLVWSRQQQPMWGSATA